MEKFEIYGHTDSDDTDEYNQVLSENRANSVKDFLIKNGITANITTTGFGEKIISSVVTGYKKARFTAMFNPFHDTYGAGYQLINGLISFATGGLKGRGIGQSIRKYTDFPASNTDFILAIVVEETGMLGFGLLMLLYGTILIQLFRYAIKMKSEAGKMILIGTAMYLLVHMVFNIGGATGLIPLTGVPLLMISAGGSSTWSFMMCIGISQAIISQFNRGEIQ